MSKPSFLNAQLPWHHLEIDQVFTQLQSEVNGLSYVAARQRLRHYGANKLPHPRPIRRIVTKPLTSPLTYLLLVVAAIAQYLGGEGWALLLVGLLNALLGIALNIWAVKTLETASLGRSQRRQDIPSQEAVVRRDGEEMDIPNRDLVVGDVVLLRVGDRPSVDIRLIEAKDLQANQASIGGAAIAPKQADELLAPDTPVLERTNLVYAGSEITEGEGVGVVVAAGRLSHWQLTAQHQPPFSVMHNQMQQLRLLWLGCAVAVTLVLIILTWLYGLNWQGLAVLIPVLFVSTYPQHLLRIATQAQLLGMKALAKKRLWVRFPAAIDALSRLTIILLILESDIALSIDNLDIAGIQWRGLIRASESDANSLGKLLGIEVNSYFEAPAERIRSWQQESEYPQSVAVIGKDPEDISLLRQADLGISERSCKKVIQDSAGLILPKEDFHYIPMAIAEGRAVFDRLQRFVLVIASSAGAVFVLTIMAIAADVAVIPTQLIWTGAIVTPVVALPLILEPAATNIMGQPARKFQQILRRSNCWRLLLGVLTISTSVAVVFWLKYQGNPSSLAEARSMAFIILVFSQISHVCALCRRSLIKNLKLTSILVILTLIQVAIVQTATLGELFGTVPLGYIEWAIAALAATAIFWLQELFRSE